MPKPALLAIVGVILACSLNSAAADRKTLADLPPEAQVSIKAAMLRDSATPDLTINDYTLTASDGVSYAEFGTSVAIDGNTVVVGATELYGNGAVYVFVKPANGWANMTQTAELTASDGQSGDGLGCSVGISGNTIIAGACNATVNGNVVEGAEYVFVEPPTGWANMTETAKLTASDALSSAYFGAASAISGNTVVVGAPYGSIENEGPGASYVFVEPQSGWTNMTQTAELTPSNRMNLDGFGYAVSISSKTVVVGGGQCDSCTGTGYVFVEPAGGWTNTTETAQLTPSEGEPNGGFGQSVSISGNTVAVGDSIAGFGGLGAVYVFVEPAGGWNNMTQTAELTNAKQHGCLGTSVSIVGNIILAGDQCADGYKGSAFVFMKPHDGWQNSSHFAAMLSIPFKPNRDYFGRSVAISGTTGVVGAPDALDVAGEAFIFTPQ